jgi:hypothetical protein
MAPCNNVRFAYRGNDTFGQALAKLLGEITIIFKKDANSTRTDSADLGALVASIVLNRDSAPNITVRPSTETHAICPACRNCYNHQAPSDASKMSPAAPKRSTRPSTSQELFIRRRDVLRWLRLNLPKGVPLTLKLVLDLVDPDGEVF